MAIKQNHTVHKLPIKVFSIPITMFSNELDMLTRKFCMNSANIAGLFDHLVHQFPQARIYLFQVLNQVEKMISPRTVSKLTFSLPFIKCWQAFEVSRAAYVKSFRQHAFDPILLIRTAGYFHKTFIRHCLCFVVLQLHYSIRKDQP